MRAHRLCQECYRYGEAALLGLTRRSLTRLIRPPGKADIDWAFVMPSPVLWAIRGEETDLKIMLNTHNIHYIMSHFTAFLILLKLLRNVDGLKELSISSSSSSTRFVSMHFSGQFAGLLSKYTGAQFNFHQSQFFPFVPDLWKKVLPEPFHLSLNDEPLFILTASHKHRQVFSAPQTPHPIIRVQIVNLDSFTQNSVPTPHHALWTCEKDLALPGLWPGLGIHSWLSSALLFCSSCSWFWQQTISREMIVCEDESVGGSRG